MDIKDYINEKPQMNFKEFFSGNLKACGIIQNWRGKIISRFDLSMNGKWQGNNGILKENFKFYDGQKKNRLWKITKESQSRFIGEADDIIGKAYCEIKGNACRSYYSMNISVGKRSYKIKFDDWLWQMNNNVVINRSYMKKFGFTVAELTMFIEKEK